MDKLNNLAIEVKGLSKKYNINENTDEQIGFSALNNISFTLYRGDVMGVIGSNGSGKSTLLKILAEVIKPSSGEAAIYGNVTSILDIGDNFHPDLSGRENVNIQLKLSGVPKSEHKRYAQDILKFSEIGDFYDHPVKVYSNGMFLRLAFSLAMHMASDILILDEVLSVGDEGFRLKCNEMLRSFSDQGKTILFVSHNRIEVHELANRLMWLDKGSIKKIGDPSEILGEYFIMHRDNHDGKKQIIEVNNPFQDIGTIHMDWEEKEAPGNGVMVIRHLSVISTSKSNKIYNHESITIKFVIDKKMEGLRIGAFFFIQDMFYQPVMVGHFLNNTKYVDFSDELKEETGLIEISCEVPPKFLIPGKYYLIIRFGMEEQEWSALSQEAFRFSETLSFTIHPQSEYIDFVGDHSKGAVRPVLNWKIGKL